jgi:DNA invertase Pin-like site-specific DNA recombinase
MSRRRGDGTEPRRGKLRCAIYTRKSSDEGLEQDFNSLDAQREACGAFIVSQKHEGWVVLPALYDDGGFSGGTMERPALQRLLADVASGQIDVVVVYKIDRLTRSLLDFARIVEIFDGREVSFVSVTQQFNTTTSMGRLTLNVLLSFAQFEREITGERIRDKIAASKKKGMWMGGQPPLGYDVRDRKLVVNEAEAGTVRMIFRRYLDLKSVRALKESLDASGVVSKVRTASDGSTYGGKPIATGALYHLLQNRIYRGEIVHKDKSYPGEHPAIVDDALWGAVQTVLAGNRVDRANGTTAKAPSILAGMLFDAFGERMTPSHAVKAGTRYRYYVSRPLLSAGARSMKSGQRIPAASLEALVTGRIGDWLIDGAAVLDAISGHIADGTVQQRAIAAARHLGKSLQDLRSDEARSLLLAICRRVQVLSDHIEVTIDKLGLMERLRPQSAEDEPPDAKPLPSKDDATFVLTIPARLRRAGMEMRMVVDDGSEPARVDSGLVRVLVRAVAIRDRLLNDHSLTLKDIAGLEGIVPSYATRLFRLTFLAPDIIATILDGRQPPELTVRKLLDDTRLPLDWVEQRTRLGFA